MLGNELASETVPPTEPFIMAGSRKLAEPASTWSDSFHVLAGSANFLLPAMMNGSVGGTVSLANSFPSIVMELFRYGQTRDEARGVPLQTRVTRINKMISGPY